MRCVNAVIMQDFQDERHMLMRPVDRVTKEAWYQLVVDVVTGNCAKVQNGIYVEPMGVLEVSGPGKDATTAAAPTVMKKIA